MASPHIPEAEPADVYLCADDDGCPSGGAFSPLAADLKSLRALLRILVGAPSAFAFAPPRGLR